MSRSIETNRYPNVPYSIQWRGFYSVAITQTPQNIAISKFFRDKHLRRQFFCLKSIYTTEEEFFYSAAITQTPQNVAISKFFSNKHLRKRFFCINSIYATTEKSTLLEFFYSAALTQTPQNVAISKFFSNIYENDSSASIPFMQQLKRAGSRVDIRVPNTYLHCDVDQSEWLV
ncbi:hypothetical protein JTE90_020585 [Oedothorax gibbosus]|uniref:Uncharacterized protein n=1 Tax=Oedothorax gibbosus TaxID=931172 RepID=A0AAV6VXX4_9ARAC|nr:hypothetical protein JTE90_020585 [Oedothorax gibbosus]